MNTHELPGTRRPARPLPLVAAAMGALILAMWAGLVRLGWPLPSGWPGPPAMHGPLMIAGFLGTLMGVERAVAIGGRWPFVAPALSAAGALATTAAPTSPAGPLLIAVGSLGLVAVFAALIRRLPAPYTVLMALGAVLWLLGNVVWLAGAALPVVALWWAGFLVLTIVGERLELSRLTRPSRRARAALWLAVALVCVGIAGRSFIGVGWARATGVGFLGLALWLLRFDLARYTVRQPGVTRFSAISLLSGYAWLAASGALWIWHAGGLPGSLHDAMLHGVFLGFVVSMVFGHAPIILPAITGRSVPYRRAFYVHLAVLHASLVLRVAGDLARWTPARQWGGLLNVAALLLFLLTTGRAVAGASGGNPVGPREGRPA
jgi:hypothetical protein